MIIIGNRRNYDHGEYVGRPTPLGNPYPLNDESDRDDMCDYYESWFIQQIIEQNPLIVAELKRLQALHRMYKSLTLICWCAPKRCHAETIKKWLEANP